MQTGTTYKNIFFYKEVTSANTANVDDLQALKNNQFSSFQSIKFMNTVEVTEDTLATSFTRHENDLGYFLEDFTNTISSQNLAQIKDPIKLDELDSREIDVLVKRKHLFQVIYWVKNNLLVKSIESKRKSYITTLNILLNDGDSLKINLI